MNQEISQYQKAAALMALDIGLLYQCAEDEPEKALQFFKMLYERAVEVQENDDVRDSRYSSACTILSLAGDDEYLL